MHVYQQGDQWVEGEYPSILAIGDSWFWYPANNVLEALIRHPRLHPDYGYIQALGQNGALLQDYVGAGRFARAMEYHLSFGVRHGFAAFFISGAGNDAVDYRLALHDDCSGIADPAACLDPERTAYLFKQVASAIGALIFEIRWAYQNEEKLARPIVIHGYDYAIPDGRGFASPLGLVRSGPWLAPALDRAGVRPDLAFRTAVVAALIDGLNDVLGRFHDPANHVVYIDSRGTLSSGEDYQFEWANELHPTRLGFNRIVDEHWIPALAPYGMVRAESTIPVRRTRDTVRRPD